MVAEIWTYRIVDQLVALKLYIIILNDHWVRNYCHPWNMYVLFCKMNNKSSQEFKCVEIRWLGDVKEWTASMICVGSQRTTWPGVIMSVMLPQRTDVLPPTH